MPMPPWFWQLMFALLAAFFSFLGGLASTPGG